MGIAPPRSRLDRFQELLVVGGGPLDLVYSDSPQPTPVLLQSSVRLATLEKRKATSISKDLLRKSTQLDASISRRFVFAGAGREGS